MKVWAMCMGVGIPLAWIACLSALVVISISLFGVEGPALVEIFFAGLLASVFFGVFAGAFMGSVCTPFAIYKLKYKNLNEAAGALLKCLAPVTFVLSVVFLCLGWATRVWSILLLPVIVGVVFHFLCARLSGILPDLKRFQHPYPFCLNCEYNLTGNTTGVCPECGEAVDSGWRGIPGSHGASAGDVI